jgi:hypothetical protein
MASRLLIFDHFAKPLAEINAPTTPRSWILDDIGRAEFSISTSDAKCTEANFQYGNLVHIVHVPTKDENGTTNGQLPPWTGIILPPRTWDYGVLHAVAYSAEALLSFRPMPHVSLNGSPAVIFKEVITYAQQAASNIPIQLGTVDDANVTLGAELRLSAFEHIRSLSRSANMNFDVTGELDKYGNLILYANLYKKKGVDTALTLTNTNSELSSPMLTEQGTPTNQVFGYAQASTSANRWKAVGTHDAALGDYGPLQANIVFMGQKEQSSVGAAAQAYADANGRPIKIVKRNALDEGDAFSFLNTGNRVGVKELSAGFAPGGGFGFDAQVKILSMEYNDLSNKVPLNVEVAQ